MAWPVFQALYPEPFAHFAAMCVNAGQLKEYQFGVSVIERTLLHTAMNRFAYGAIQNGAEVLIFFDDDCKPPADAIKRLLKHYEDGKEFVAGVGFMRNYPHTTTIGRYFPEGISMYVPEDGNPEMQGHFWMDDISRLSGTVEVDFCGFPIAMVSTKLLKRMKEPWFGTQGEDGGSCTHDIYFCGKAKKAGAKIWVDTTIKCDHLGAAPWITFDNRTRIRDMVAGKAAK